MEGPPGAGEDGQCHGPLELAHVSEAQNRVSSYSVLGFRVYQNCQDVLQNGEFHGPLEPAHVSESQNRVSSYRIFAKQATRSICPLSFIFSNLQKQFKFWRWSPIFQNCKYNSSSDGDLLFSKIGQTWLRIMGDMQDKWPKQGHFGQNKAIPCSFAVWVKKLGILCKPVKKEGDAIKQQNGAIQCSSSEDNRGGMVCKKNRRKLNATKKGQLHELVELQAPCNNLHTKLVALLCIFYLCVDKHR